MIDQSPDPAARLRRLRTDLRLKMGDLKTCAGKLRRAQDFGHVRKAEALLKEFNKIKSTIEDVRKAIAEAEEVLV